jgi:hypothetical protein
MNIIIISLLIAIPALVYFILSLVTPSRIAVATTTINIEASIDWLFQVIAVDRRQAFRNDLENLLMTHHQSTTKRSARLPIIYSRLISKDLVSVVSG